MSKNVFQEGIKDYSINLMWINKVKQDEQQYIHNAKTKDELVDKFLTSAIKWSKANDTADVNIWYDSTVSTVQSIQNTKAVLNELGNLDGSNNLRFRDIRDIEIVTQNQNLFTSKIPFYFRIDIFKMIICLHSLKNDLKDAVIFSDTGVGDYRNDQSRMNKDELFDQESMEKLEKCGILLNGGLRPENQFIQMINDTTAITALTYAINACFMREVELFNNQHMNQSILTPKMYLIPFLSTTEDVHKYYKAIKLGGIQVRADIVTVGTQDQWVKYDPNVHGYKPLGNILVKCSGENWYNGFGYLANGAKKWIKVESILKFNFPESHEKNFEDLNFNNFELQENPELPEANDYDYRVRNVDVRLGNEHHDDSVVLSKEERPMNYIPLKDDRLLESLTFDHETQDLYLFNSLDILDFGLEHTTPQVPLLAHQECSED